MANQTITLAPDAILALLNLSGAVTDIDEDPDAASDTTWLIASGNSVNTEVRASFPTPPGNLVGGAGLQEFRARVRRFSLTQSGVPNARIELWNAGVLVRAGAEVAVGTTDTVLSLPWNASEVSGSAGVEIKVVGTATGGSPGARNTVEVGAVEWNATYNTANTWAFKAAIPSAWVFGSAVAVGDLIFGFAGRGPGLLVSSSVRVYNPVADAWLADRTPMPVWRSPIQVAAIGSKVYLAATARDRRVDIYDTATDTWSPGTPSIRNRSAAQVVAIGTKLYLLGGKSTELGGEWDATCEVYDSVADTWNFIASLPFIASLGRAVVINGRIYTAKSAPVTSGGSGNNRMQSYDPANNTWTQLNSGLLGERYSYAGGAIDDRYFIACGNNNLDQARAEAEMFLLTNTYQQLANSPEVRSDMASAVYGRQLFVIGGYAADKTAPLTTTLAYTPPDAPPPVVVASAWTVGAVRIG